MKKENKVIKYVRGLILRCMALVAIFLIMAIFYRSNQVFKDYIVTNVYTNNLKFTKIKNIYNKYLGGIVPLEKIDKNIIPVFKEELDYSNPTKYYDGVSLEVVNQYLVPVISSGMVVYIGEKENYNNTIIVEGVDGVDIWYGNMESINVSLYDYIEEGKLLGKTKDNHLYLVYEKDNKYLDYSNYLNKWKYNFIIHI